jgi:ribosomal-protein-alanine N-acetyltransferase
LACPEALPTLELGLPGWSLRAWQADDAPSLATHANNVNVWRWMSDAFPHPYTLEIAEHWVRRGHVEFGGDHWAIAFEGQAVGGCGLAPMDGALRCNAEIGWWLAEAHWGRGVATRVARRLVQWGWADPGRTRLCAPIHAGNTRSMRVAEKAGLTLEGIQRRSAWKGGQIIDRHCYAIVRSERDVGPA